MRFAKITILMLTVWSVPFFLRAQLPDGFARQRIAGGLDPTTMALAPDGRIFISEKNGRVRIVRDGRLLPEPFLTIAVDNFNERGLSGLAFHPGFERNNLVYVYYTLPDGSRNRISRFTANGDFAVPGSEEVILELDALSGPIHNGGAMAFGPDGKLYVATGDGTLPENAQRLDNLLGKVLRINDDGSIPPDNPFAGQTTGNNRAIWALGLRNPFTFAIQPGTGRLFVNDVGSQFWEEVNDIVAGGNYGWARLEGPRAGQQAPAGYRDPFYAYDHNAGCAVIGATFYDPARPSFPPRYHGQYFFADYCGGYIKVLDPAGGALRETFLTGVDRPISLLVDQRGDLYYLERAGMGGGSPQDNTSSAEGALWRVFYAGDGAPVIAVQPADRLLPVGEPAAFSITATGSAPLRYQWERDGAPIDGAAGPELRLDAVRLADDGARFRCVVSNGEGRAVSREALLRVTTNTRPAPEILAPDPGLTYRAGDTLRFAGRATDAEDGPLPAERLTWRIDFHHDEHTHPALEATEGIDGGAFAIPRIGEIDDNVWYRIHLTATDAGGLSRGVFRDVFPEKTRFTVLSEPSGLEVNVDGRLVTTPHTTTSVMGIRRTLSAAPVQLRAGRLYRFQGWSEGWDDPFYPFLAGDRDTIRLHYAEQELFIGEGRGLLGTYHQGQAPAAFGTRPLLARIDPVVDFDWGGGSPDTRVPADNFVVRWRGEVLAPVDGRYTFHTITDDGVRLWVGEQLLIDQWVPQPATEATGAIELRAGQRYPIQMEYFEAGGQAVARLLWSTGVLPRQLIPTAQLYPAPRLDFPEAYQVRLYPSPARDWLRVDVVSKVDDALTLRVYDLSGRLCLRRDGFRARRDQRENFDLDLRGLAPGMYLLDIQGATYIREWTKFVKH